MKKQSVSCSFCGKTPANVAKIITGPGVNICDECVDLCRGILEGERAKESAKVDGPTMDGTLFVRWADGTTEEMRGMDLYLNSWGPVRRFSRFTRTQFGDEPARVVVNSRVEDLMIAVSYWASVAFRAKEDSKPEPVSETDRLEPDDGTPHDCNTCRHENGGDPCMGCYSEESDERPHWEGK
jgi:hypothetical protein